MPEVLPPPDVDDGLDDAPADVEQQVRKKLRDTGDRSEFLLEPLRGRETDKISTGTTGCSRLDDVTETVVAPMIAHGVYNAAVAVSAIVSTHPQAH